MHPEQTNLKEERDFVGVSWYAISYQPPPNKHFMGVK